MSMCKRAMAALAAAGVLLVAGAGVASAATAEPNCLAATIKGAVSDPAGTVTGTLNDPGATVSGTVTCVTSFLG